MRKWIIPALSAGAIGLFATLSMAGPAQAHRVYQGNDYATHSYDGTLLKICDAEDDGHKVWAGYYDNGSNTYHTAVVIYYNDTDGLDCTTWGLGGDRILTNLRAVEDNPNSSTNYYSPWHGWPVAGT
jgi:hypothetical protein